MPVTHEVGGDLLRGIADLLRDRFPQGPVLGVESRRPPGSISGAARYGVLPRDSGRRYRLLVCSKTKPWTKVTTFSDQDRNLRLTQFGCGDKPKASAACSWRDHVVRMSQKRHTQKKWGGAHYCCSLGAHGRDTKNKNEPGKGY